MLSSSDLQAPSERAAERAGFELGQFSDVHFLSCSTRSGVPLELSDFIGMGCEQRQTAAYNTTVALSLLWKKNVFFIINTVTGKKHCAAGLFYDAGVVLK